MFLEAGMSKTKTCGKGLLPGLPKDAFSLHPHMAGKEQESK